MNIFAEVTIDETGIIKQIDAVKEAADRFEDEARKSLFKFMLELSDEDIAALDRLMKKAIEFTQNNKEKD